MVHSSRTLDPLFLLCWEASSAWISGTCLHDAIVAAVQPSQIVLLVYYWSVRILWTNRICCRLSIKGVKYTVCSTRKLIVNELAPWRPSCVELMATIGKQQASVSVRGEVSNHFDGLECDGSIGCKSTVPVWIVCLTRRHMSSVDGPSSRWKPEGRCFLICQLNVIWKSLCTSSLISYDCRVESLVAKGYRGEGGDLGPLWSATHGIDGHLVSLSWCSCFQAFIQQRIFISSMGSGGENKTYPPPANPRRQLPDFMNSVVGISYSNGATTPTLRFKVFREGNLDYSCGAWRDTVVWCWGEVWLNSCVGCAIGVWIKAINHHEPWQQSSRLKWKWLTWVKWALGCRNLCVIQVEFGG